MDNSMPEPFANSGKTHQEIMAELNAEIERDEARLSGEGIQIAKVAPDFGRTLPRLYLDIDKIVHDPRRVLFEKGGAAIYDSLLLRIAASPGAKFPWRNLPTVVARALDAQEADVQAMLNIALDEGLLVNEDGNLSGPLITKAYRDGVHKCATNAISGKKGGKTQKKKRL